MSNQATEIKTMAEENTEADLASIMAPAVEVEKFMADFLKRRPFPTNLKEAIEYSLLGPGKRTRPILVMRACEAVGGKTDDALPAAAAIEMIHCFSLIHDDLPAMDDDDMRRGRPTLHKKTNDAMAILAGDALTSLAFEVLVTRVPDNRLANACVRELSTATNDMIAGQVYDTLPEFEDDLEPIEQLELIHKHKTGALLRCACRMGAIAGDADAAELEALTNYAEAIGLMFQIVDDILDVTAEAEHLGKATQKDADAGKLTYPGLLGLETSQREVTRLHEESIKALASLGPNADPLRELADFLATRSK